MSIEILGHVNRKYLEHRNIWTRAYKYRDTSIDTYELAKLDHTNRLYSNLNFKRKQEQLNNSMLVFVSFYTQIGFYAYIHRFLCTMKFGPWINCIQCSNLEKNNNGSTFLYLCSYISMLTFVCFYAQKNYHIES